MNRFGFSVFTWVGSFHVYDCLGLWLYLRKNHKTILPTLFKCLLGREPDIFFFFFGKEDEISLAIKPEGQTVQKKRCLEEQTPTGPLKGKII